MVERTDRADLLDNDPFLSEPGDALVVAVATTLAVDPVWGTIFKDAIEPYKRMDFGSREFPAIRVYNDTGKKEAETWYLSGDLKIDMIFPVATRRGNLQRIADQLCAAMMAQFRRASFFQTILSMVPGLTQLGWTYTYDKALAFQPVESSDPLPMVQVSPNFKILLNAWDTYLESQGRTSDDPYEVTLGNLQHLVGAIKGLNDNGSTAITIPVQQTISQTAPTGVQTTVVKEI